MEKELVPDPTHTKNVSQISMYENFNIYNSRDFNWSQYMHLIPVPLPLLDTF